MENMTLALAVLLGAGFGIAKLGQMIRLPSVTGYICAGLLLGPSGLNLITVEVMGSKLNHFSQIALMLIAFGIGEHLEFRKLRHSIKSVGSIGLAETSTAFILVSVTTFFAAWITDAGPESWGVKDFIALSLLLGAISSATAPAATLHVMRELKAAGPLTTTLMSVVAIDNGFAIMFFGIAASIARQIVGAGNGSMVGAVGVSFTEIGGSLLLGVGTGLLIDFIVHRLNRRGEMLTVGLALLLLCGEGARLFHFSQLLAGMAAGLTIVNRDHRDVRMFQALNSFGPPIYVLFFALAGAHLDFSSLAVAGWVGVAYFVFRALGKIFGVRVGVLFTHTPAAVRTYLGLALVPQAGVAIGFIFLIHSDAILASYSNIITPVVLAGIVMSELVGPICAKWAVENAGEAPGSGREKAFPELAECKTNVSSDINRPHLVEWTWGKLAPPEQPEGVVLFGAAHAATVTGLARVATLLGHYYKALPMAVRVDIVHDSESREIKGGTELFSLEKAEAEKMGYTLATSLIQSSTISEGILFAAKRHHAKAIVLGHPVEGTAQEFEKVVEQVAKDTNCRIIVTRFFGVLHTERILVPLVRSSDLDAVADVVSSLSGVGNHRITLLQLMPPDTLEEELEEMEVKLREWAKQKKLTPYVYSRAVATEARLETIFEEACHHDLLVMASNRAKGLHRFFFGSLAEWVARECTRPLLMILNPKN